MAFWGEGNISGGWQGLLGRKKRWPNTRPPGLVPRRLPTAPYQGMEPTATLGVADSAWDTTHTPMAGKKGLNWEEISEVMSEMQMMEPEFVQGGKYGRTQEYAALPYSFDEAGMAEMQKRKKLFPFLA